MTYAEAVAFLYDRLPAFERGGGVKSIKPGLENIRLLTAALGDPHTRFPSIHVGGTNGKGSSSHMLAAVYGAAGYRVGLYTSPHLKSLTERIRVNGESIPESAVADFVTTNLQLIDTIGPSFFEVTVAMAFDYFARMEVDLAIVEVGLGGRLDSTNIITPVLSLITNVGFDHQELLGDTLEAIAKEKAGIIKPGIPVVISEFQESLMDIYVQYAMLNDCILYNSIKLIIINIINKYTGEYVVNYIDNDNIALVNDFVDNHKFRVGLLGAYQQKNLAGVLTVLAVLADTFPVDRLAVGQGLAEVTQRTGLKGRWQILGQDPLVVADTAHNLPGIEAVLVTVSNYVYRRLFVILGVVRDKDVGAVLSILPKEATYYFCTFDSPRAKPAQNLLTEAAEFGLVGMLAGSVNEALTSARAIAGNDDLILITGSTYLVAEIDSL